MDDTDTVTYNILNARVSDATRKGVKKVDEALEEMYMFIYDMMRNMRVIYVRSSYIIEYFPWAMSRGYENEESFYRYINRGKYSPWIVTLIMRMISEGHINIEDVKERLVPLEVADTRGSVYSFLSDTLAYVFGDEEVSTIIDHLETVEWYPKYKYVRQLLESCAAVSGMKTRELASSLIARYGCERIFSCAYVSDGYSTGYELFAENVVISSCEKPITEYRVRSLLSHTWARQRLLYLRGLPKESV